MHGQEFLERIHRRLTGAQAPPLPEELPRTQASGNGQRLAERFTAALSSAGGEARLVPTADLAVAVAEAATAISCRTAIVTPDLGQYEPEVRAGLARAGTEVLEPADDGWRWTAAHADLGVTSGLAAVASSGSVLIGAGPDSIRLASLLPPAHLAVLPVGRLVAGFEELLAEMGRLVAGRSGAVLVTGPSRTADIEMTIVRGVHGPRTVEVLLVEEDV